MNQFHIEERYDLYFIENNVFFLLVPDPGCIIVDLLSYTLIVHCEIR